MIRPTDGCIVSPVGWSRELRSWAGTLWLWLSWGPQCRAQRLVPSPPRAFRECSGKRTWLYSLPSGLGTWFSSLVELLYHPFSGSEQHRGLSFRSVVPKSKMALGWNRGVGRSVELSGGLRGKMHCLAFPAAGGTAFRGPGSFPLLHASCIAPLWPCHRPQLSLTRTHPPSRGLFRLLTWIIQGHLPVSRSLVSNLSSPLPNKGIINGSGD